MILLTKSPGSPKKLPGSPQEATKKIQGRNPYNIFVAILVETMTPKRHFEIDRPLAEEESSMQDLYTIMALVKAKVWGNAAKCFSSVFS